MLTFTSRPLLHYSLDSPKLLEVNIRGLPESITNLMVFLCWLLLMQFGEMMLLILGFRRCCLTESVVGFGSLFPHFSFSPLRNLDPEGPLRPACNPEGDPANPMVMGTGFGMDHWNWVEKQIVVGCFSPLNILATRALGR